MAGVLASATPAANKVPIADGAGKLAAGWIDLSTTVLLTGAQTIAGQKTFTDPLQTSGGRRLATQSVVSAAGTTAIAAGTECAVLTGATTHTFTLPAAVNGQKLYVKNRSSGALTVNPDGTDTIDGLASLGLAAGLGCALVAVGADWLVMTGV